MTGSRLLTVDAIVIERKNLGEADRMMTIFTLKYGKLRVIAKGVRKISSRRGPHIEIFNRIMATIHDKKTLTEVATAENFPLLRSSLKRIGAAYYLCELIDGLLPIEQPHEDVFTLLLSAFASLSKVKLARIDELRARFAAALLTRLGYMAAGKKYKENDIDAYVESILERRLKTVRLASRFNI